MGYHHLKGIIKKKYGLDATAVGDEGGFAPNFQNNGEALELLVEAIKKSGYEGKIQIGMDIAAAEFFKNGSTILISKTQSRSKLTGFRLMSLERCTRDLSKIILSFRLKIRLTRTTGRDIQN